MAGSSDNTEAAGDGGADKAPPSFHPVPLRRWLIRWQQERYERSRRRWAAEIGSPLRTTGRGYD